MAYQDWISEGIRKLISEQPEWYNICVDHHALAMNGGLRLDVGERWEVDYRALFVQTFRNTDDLVAGYIVARLHRWLAEGHAQVVAVEVGEEPRADAEFEENRRTLQRLPEPFKADLWCGTADRDGELTVPASWFGLTRVPLEVGTCDPRTLWLHLKAAVGFARWPYGSRWIYAYGLDHETWETCLAVSL